MSGLFCPPFFLGGGGIFFVERASVSRHESYHKAGKEIHSPPFVSLMVNILLVTELQVIIFMEGLWTNFVRVK